MYDGGVTMRIVLLVTLGAASLSIVGCDGEPGICGGAELSQVQTREEEAEAMQRFRDECRPLSMRAYDAADEALSLSDTDWMSHVHHVSLSGAGSRLFEHTVIEGNNLGLLMGE